MGEKNSRSCAHKSIHTDSFVNGAMNAQMREREGVRKTEREKERQSGSACFHITYTPHCSTQYDSPRFDYSLKVINKWPVPPLLPPSPAWLPALAYVSASCQNEKHFPRCRFSLNAGKGGTQKKKRKIEEKLKFGNLQKLLKSRHRFTLLKNNNRVAESCALALGQSCQSFAILLPLYLSPFPPPALFMRLFAFHRQIGRKNIFNLIKTHKKYKAKAKQNIFATPPQTRPHAPRVAQCSQLNCQLSQNNNVNCFANEII